MDRRDPLTLPSPPVGERVPAGRVRGLAVAMTFALLLALSPEGAAPNPAARGVASNFIVPTTKDAQGRTIGIRGSSGRFLSNDQAELTGLTLTISGGPGSPEFIVEAKSCLWDRQTGLTTSFGPLSLRSSDGKFELSGEGFRFDSAKSSLVVSNSVTGRIAKSFSGAPGIVGPSVPRTTTGSNAPTVPDPKPDEFVEISSTTFEFTPERVEFRRAVRVRDGESSMEAERLTGRLVTGGGIERVEGEGLVRFVRGDLRTSSDAATYSPGNGRVALHGNVQWSLGQRTGMADDLSIDSTANRFTANGDVSVKLPSTTLLPVDWLGTNQTLGAPAELQIRSHALEFGGDHATFSDMVWVTDGVGTELSAGVLEVTFATNKVTQLVARDSVQLRAGNATLAAARVSYSAETGLAVFTGDLAWTVLQIAGSSDEVALDSKAKEFRATGHVQAKVPNTSLSLPENQTKNNATKPRPARSLRIDSDRLVAMNGKAVFLGQAGVVDESDSTRGLTADVLAAFFDAKGKLEHLMAESSVRVRSAQGDALGGKAAYDIAKEQIDLFESPRIALRDQQYTADRFVFDLATGKVEIVGAYRIELDPLAFQKTNAPQKPAAK